MDRSRQIIHLAEAERHVAASLRHIARQQAIIMALQRRGDDMTLAQSVLATFVQSLTFHEGHLAQIRDELTRNG